jgi:hypothetical protein
LHRRLVHVGVFFDRQKNRPRPSGVSVLFRLLPLL